MFLAVRSFYFFWEIGCSLSRWGMESFEAEATTIILSSTVDILHTLRLVISFHSNLLVFSSTLFTKILLSFVFSIKVKFPHVLNTLQSPGSFILKGLPIYLDGFVLSWPSAALPHPCTTYSSGFSLLHSSILNFNFSCNFWLTMPKTSSMYFLSISSNTFPVTFYVLRIFM